MKLYAYIHQTLPPEDAATTLEAFTYLEACSKLFKKGFLSYDCIRSMDSRIYKMITLIFQGGLLLG